ncbi:MAG: DUF6973 domain-containing protein [Bacteroidota bacterium]|jgi:hypothetical protein
MNARDLGYGIARLFGRAHESGLLNNEQQKEMDLFNNEEGYYINWLLGDKNTNTNLSVNIFNHAINGGLRVIENKKIVKSGL